MLISDINKYLEFEQGKNQKIVRTYNCKGFKYEFIEKGIELRDGKTHKAYEVWLSHKLFSVKTKVYEVCPDALLYFPHMTPLSFDEIKERAFMMKIKDIDNYLEMLKGLEMLPSMTYEEVQKIEKRNNELWDEYHKQMTESGLFDEDIDCEELEKRRAEAGIKEPEEREDYIELDYSKWLYQVKSEQEAKELSEIVELHRIINFANEQIQEAIMKTLDGGDEDTEDE